MKRGLIAVILMMSMWLTLAMAEDVCTVADAFGVEGIRTGCSYLRVSCELEGEQRVTVTVRDAWGGLIYQRDHGVRSGTFRSGEIHLPLADAEETYVVTITAGDASHSFQVVRERPLLTDTAVYAYRLPLSELNGGSSRKYAVLLDMAALDGSVLTVPMVSSGMEIGSVHLAVSGGVITVDAELTAEGSIDKLRVYAAADALTAKTLGTSRFTGVKGRAGQGIDLGSTPYAAVMIQLTVSFDESTAAPFRRDRDAEQRHLLTWRDMEEATPNAANG